MIKVKNICKTYKVSKEMELWKHQNHFFIKTMNIYKLLIIFILTLIRVK